MKRLFLTIFAHLALAAEPILSPADIAALPPALRATARAAADGDAASMLLYANALAAGSDGLPADPAAAFAWRSRAADAGDVDALVSVGASFEAGEGVIADNARAFDFYKRAADKGNAVAQFNVALFHMNAWGGAHVDDRISFYYFTLAAAQGHPHAMSNLGFCYEHGRGTAEDAAAARRWYSSAVARAGEIGDEVLRKDALAAMESLGDDASL